MDTSDDVMSIAIITCEVSGDPRLRILKYNAAMTPSMFKMNTADGPYTEDSLWLGYAVSYYFNVNDDDSVTVEEQTDSAGMWSVYKTYRLSGGYYTEVVPKSYEVLPDFMEKRFLYGGSLSGEELTKWNQGYVKAYAEYAGQGITLYPGDYFKVISDDGKNNLSIEKENGETGRINVDYSNPNRYSLNEFYFYLAG